jgi:hypothetical protein
MAHAEVSRLRIQNRAVLGTRALCKAKADAEHRTRIPRTAPFKVLTWLQEPDRVLL